MSINKADLKLGATYLMNSGKRRKIVALDGKVLSGEDPSGDNVYQYFAGYVTYKALDRGDVVRRGRYNTYITGTFAHHVDRCLENPMEIKKNKFATFDTVNEVYARFDSLKDARKHCEEQLRGGLPGPFEILKVTGVAERYCVQFKDVN